MARYEIDNLPAPIDFQESDVLQRTLQNAKNLLMCHLGEVPYDRYRGFDPVLYGLPLPALRARLLPELDRVMMWEPDVEVADAQIDVMADGSLYIRVILEIAMET